jgi:asparagine synthase (glutamine-hydrolysing)
MCGIAGYIGDSPSAKEFLRNSIECLKHRGPDGEGLIDLNWAGISHVRLSLISPGPNGAQPVHGEEIILSFNGEIYNWREIGAQLRATGLRADLSSDSKVLLHSLEEWGLNNTLEKLRGIFAFAYLDKKKKCLILARDSAGTKPLYYINFNGTIYFSSEIKAFKDFGLAIDQEQIEEYLTFQNTISEKCIFKNVFLVPSGGYLEFRKSQSRPNQTIWAPGVFTTNPAITSSIAIDEIEKLMEQAVQRNLRADFPVGVFLSGGLDSSTLAMFAAEKNQNIRSYTIGFKQAENIANFNFTDERVHALEIAKKLEIENLTAEITSTDMEEIFDELCWAIEEPRVGQSYPNFFAAKLAKQSDKAVISGTGGDELFGGYPWRYRETLALKSAGKPKQVEAYFEKWHRLSSTKNISQLLGKQESSHVMSGKQKMINLLETNSTSDSFYDLQDLLYFEYKTFLQGLLIVDDKIAMSHGLEIRVPMLDQDLTNFAMQLPNTLRLKTPSSSPLKIEDDGKFLLRILAGKMNNPLQNLPKRGFSGPDEMWFRKESSTFIQNRLFDSNSIIWRYLDFETGKKMVTQHLTGEINNRLLIWSLLSLESVFRQFSSDS